MCNRYVAVLAVVAMVAATGCGQARSSASDKGPVADASGCTVCHAFPPAAPHPTLASPFGPATCAACHPGTVNPDGTIDKAGGKHMNGTVDGFTGHPTGWMDPFASAFHGLAAAPDTAACAKCHAVTPPAVVTLVTCSDCHPNAGNGVWAVACNTCHGSARSPAPPKDLSGNTATTARGVGAHQSHLQGTHSIAAPLACASCHVVPASSAAPGHMDGAVQVTGYTGTDPALAAAVTSPGWSAGSASCATSYCHGASPMLGGGSVPVPQWTRVDGGQAACGSCHGLPPTGHATLAPGSDAATCAVCHPGTVRPDGTIDVAGGLHVNGRAEGFAGHAADWMSWGQPGFHGKAAARDVNGCFVCHAPKAPARVLAITCATCHDPLAGGNDWTTSCRGCHGGTTSPAPPFDTDGHTTTAARGVGAHQSHVTGTHGIAAPIDCVFCHRKPADVFSPGHLDGTVELTGYTGSDPALAARIPGQNWDEATLSCANYCHGATMQGGASQRPVWTRVDGSQATCGSCHGFPPTGHPALAPGFTAATCALCHPATVRSNGTIDVAGGKHLNGAYDGFAGHPAGWVSFGSAAFHGPIAKPDPTACFQCHAKTPPAYGSAVVCADCHVNLDQGNWSTGCNGCHGSNANAAPPRDLSGSRETTSIGVGAHQSHLTGAHAIAAPLDCVHCHPKPDSTSSPTHVDGRVEVTGYTGSDPTLLAQLTDPGWNRAVPTCATSYCHGATIGGGTASQPVWTRVDGTQAACGSCHGLPPPRHISLTPPVTPASCAACHPATVKGDGSIDVAGGKHLNGVVDAQGFEGHGAGWLVPGDPAFHGQAATTKGVDYCFGCHAAKEPSPNGIKTCASCHDALAGGADWTTSCIGCHGDASTSAPPKDVHGNTATTAIGVGAHRSHVEATHALAARYDCSACHVKPASTLVAGHLDGATLVTGYTGGDPAMSFIADPGWNRTTATCATSWCHGNYSGVFNYTFPDDTGTPQPRSFSYAGAAATPTWNVVNGTQGACGTCHGIPPRSSGYWHSGLHGGVYNACSLCHPGVNADGSAFTDTSQHVNGSVDVSPQWNSRCFNCH